MSRGRRWEPCIGTAAWRALLLEAMRRAARLGAEVAFVGSYGGPAHAAYESVGLRTIERLVAWRRHP